MSSHRSAAIALVLAIGALVVSPAARAQERSRPSRPDEVGDLLRAQRRAAIERRVGWAMSGSGLAAVAAGAIVLGYGLDRGQWSDVGAVVVSGSVLTAVGGALFVPGLVLALHGQERLTEVEWRLKQLGVLPIVAAGPSGVHVGASFAF